MLKISYKNLIKINIKSALDLVKNYLLFFCYILLKIYFHRKRQINKENEKKSMLFFNNGQIGDLLISSINLENEDYFDKGYNYYFLIQEQYSFMFNSYKGRFALITYDLLKYRKSIKYRIGLITRLNELNILDFYNNCAGRGMLTEEISLLNNATNKYCLNSNTIYLNKYLNNYFNKRYEKVFFNTNINEYKKTISLLKQITKIEDNQIKFNNQKLLSLKYTRTQNIVIAPYTSDLSRNWGLKNFEQLITELSQNYKITLIGSAEDNKKDSFSFSSSQVDNQIGKTSFLEVAEIINNSMVFIGNDSGLTHLALKLNKPIIAIIGGGMWNRFFPYDRGNQKNIFLSYKLDCFGCEWNCKYQEKYCLTKIQINQVQKSIYSNYKLS